MLRRDERMADVLGYGPHIPLGDVLLGLLRGHPFDRDGRLVLLHGGVERMKPLLLALTVLLISFTLVMPFASSKSQLLSQTIPGGTASGSGVPGQPSPPDTPPSGGGGVAPDPPAQIIAVLGLGAVFAGFFVAMLLLDKSRTAPRFRHSGWAVTFHKPSKKGLMSSVHAGVKKSIRVGGRRR